MRGGVAFDPRRALLVRACRPSEHAEALGDEHKLGQRVDPELLHQIVTVRFHRPLGASELMRDLLVQPAPRDAFENLKLATGFVRRSSAPALMTCTVVEISP